MKRSWLIAVLAAALAALVGATGVGGPTGSAPAAAAPVGCDVGFRPVVAVLGRILCTVVGPDVQASAANGDVVFPPEEPMYAGYQGPDVQCVDNNAQSPRFFVIYARASNYGDWYNAQKGNVAGAFILASRAMNNAAQRLTNGGAKVPIKGACYPWGELVVANAVLPTSTGATTFDTIIRDLIAQGYNKSWDKYMIFYDGPTPSSEVATNGGRVLGRATGPGGDDRPTSGNFNNLGGDYAIEFGGGYNPHWQVFLHEMGHTMGAVQNSAPHSDGRGHINPSVEQLDLMVPVLDIAGTPDRRCVFLQWDCGGGGDDYFRANLDNQYLNTHWNIAATYNSFVYAHV